MKKIIRLTESDLARIVRRVINEETEMNLVEKPKVGDIISIYKKKDVDVNFHGSVCRINGNYLYLKSTSGEKCIEYLLSIIVEYCSKTGIMTPETHSYVQLNKDVLFESEKIKGQYGGKTKKQTKKQTKNKQYNSKTNKHITRKHKKY